MTESPDRFGLKLLAREERQNLIITAKIGIWVGGFLAIYALNLWITRLTGARSPSGFLLDEAVWATVFSALLIVRGVQARHRLSKLNG